MGALFIWFSTFLQWMEENSVECLVMPSNKIWQKVGAATTYVTKDESFDWGTRKAHRGGSEIRVDENGLSSKVGVFSGRGNRIPLFKLFNVPNAACENLLRILTLVDSVSSTDGRPLS